MRSVHGRTKVLKKKIKFFSGAVCGGGSALLGIMAALRSLVKPRNVTKEFI